MSEAFNLTKEHASDVLLALERWRGEGDCALAVITNTEGGAVRDIGAMLVARSDGVSAGYLSGGCIDADVVVQCQQAMKENRFRRVRYGAGSPFLDMPLPCGGAIEIAIIPAPECSVVRELTQAIAARRPCLFSFDGDGQLFAPSRRAGAPDECVFASTIYPKLQIRIAGKGADCMALANIAQAAGIAVCLQTTDQYVAAAASKMKLGRLQTLLSPGALPQNNDDPWTAFVLMFHDIHWEAPLLLQALEGDAFYIGAVGGKKTHERRCDVLREQGVADGDINRIHGPIGLLPSMRDASALGVSTLAEIIDCYRKQALGVSDERSSA